MGFAISFYPPSSSTSSPVFSQDPCCLFSGWLVKKPVHLGTGVGAKMAHLMTGSTNSCNAHPSTCPGRTHLRPASRHRVSDEEQNQHRRETREVESKELQAGDILHSASLAVGLLTPGSFALLTNMHGISTHLTSNGSYDSSQCVA